MTTTVRKLIRCPVGGLDFATALKCADIHELEDALLMIAGAYRKGQRERLIRQALRSRRMNQQEEST